MNIDHISISRKQTWEECQQKYKYRYHLKLNPTLPTPFYFTFGKIVHKIAEEHSRCKGERTLTEVKHDVLNGKIELEPGQKCPRLENIDSIRLSQHLNNYLRLATKVGYEGYIEYPFKYDLDPPHKKEVVGLIDRLIVKNNKAVILDYKTTKPSKWRKDNKTITSDLQLACYCWVVMKEFGIPASNISASLYYLEDAKLVPVRFCEETLLSVPKILLEAYNEIQQYNPDAVFGSVTPRCKDCQYKNVCPFYSLT